MSDSADLVWPRPTLPALQDAARSRLNLRNLVYALAGLFLWSVSSSMRRCATA